MKTEFCSEFEANPNCETLYLQILYILNENMYYLPMLIGALHQSVSFASYEVRIRRQLNLRTEDNNQNQNRQLQR